MHGVGAKAQGAKDEFGLERAGVREEVGDGGGGEAVGG